MFLQLFFFWNRAHRRTVDFRVFTQFYLFRACSFSLSFFSFIESLGNLKFWFFDFANVLEIYSFFIKSRVSRRVNYLFFLLGIF
uniref:Candidate secreted effector n=1 Tax=Meloidogyne incognita TaxID=6306 RepID=A0A914NRB9_MELIC